MLVVKPNSRRMRYMRDSPSEIPDAVRNRRFVYRLRWERVLLVAVIIGVVAAALAVHFGWRFYV
jgi:hypothetical protein